MATNRRKHTGLMFVYLKNGLHPQGGQIKELERELAELNTKNEVLKTKIASLSSRAVIQRRLNDGFIKMIPISDDRIVRVSAPPQRIAVRETGRGHF